MNRISSRLCLALAFSMFGSIGNCDEGTLDAVVKIHSSNRAINLTSPWVRTSPRNVTGSGVLIGKGKVLTNAHVVLNSSDVSIQPASSSERIPAKVKILAVGIDLAVLEFKTPASMEDVEPLKLAEKSPSVRETVRVYGYPTGGDAQSVTEGIVSRIEHTSYKNGVSGLRIQIDAAINPGNSGGPVVVDGKIAGLAFSIRRGANDIGYVIPTEEIQRFMEDIKDGYYEGKPRLSLYYQYLENTTLRKKYKVSPSVSGVLFRQYVSAGEAALKKGDVITHVGDYSIDNRGKCRLENGISVSFTRLAADLAKDGKVALTILRGGKTEKLDVPVETRRRLIDYSNGRYPDYFIYGPLVFSVASANYLNAIETGANATDANQRRAMSLVKTLMVSAKSPLISKRTAYRKSPDDELVVVTRILSHPTARGYRQVPYFLVVKTINGQKVKNLAHAVEVLRDAEGEFLEISFYDGIGDDLVLDRARVVDSIERILEDNNIARQGSKHLVKIWEADAE